MAIVYYHAIKTYITTFAININIKTQDNRQKIN